MLLSIKYQQRQALIHTDCNHRSKMKKLLSSPSFSFVGFMWTGGRARHAVETSRFTSKKITHIQQKQQEVSCGDVTKLKELFCEDRHIYDDDETDSTASMEDELSWTYAGSDSNTSLLSCYREVRFAEPLVTEVYERPTTLPSERMISTIPIRNISASVEISFTVSAKASYEYMRTSSRKHTKSKGMIIHLISITVTKNSKNSLTTLSNLFSSVCEKRKNG